MTLVQLESAAALAWHAANGVYLPRNFVELLLFSMLLQYASFWVNFQMQPARAGVRIVQHE